MEPAQVLELLNGDTELHPQLSGERESWGFERECLRVCARACVCKSFSSTDSKSMRESENILRMQRERLSMGVSERKGD